MLDIVERLLLNPEVLDEATISETRAIMNWAIENLLDKNIFTVENWLEVSFHLCKQRWDSSVDWLENQPMSKIHTMIEIVQNHAKETEKAHKKAAKAKK